MQATRDSNDNSLAPSKEGEVISPEHLRFTAAILKAMSEELAPLLAGRDPTQARPCVYRGYKEVPLMVGSLSCAANGNARKPKRPPIIGPGA